MTTYWSVFMTANGQFAVAADKPRGDDEVSGQLEAPLEVPLSRGFRQSTFAGRAEWSDLGVLGGAYRDRTESQRFNGFNEPPHGNGGCVSFLVAGRSRPGEPAEEEDN